MSCPFDTSSLLLECIAHLYAFCEFHSLFLVRKLIPKHVFPVKKYLVDFYCFELSFLWN